MRLTRGNIPILFFAEAFFMLFFISIESLLYVIKVVDLPFLIISFDLFIIFLLIRAWKRFRGGLHPCWLFMLSIAFFQCGELFGYLFGNTSDPFTITLMFIPPFTISDAYRAETLLCIALAMVFVYLPCAYRFEPKRYYSNYSLPVRQMVRYIFYVFLPFDFYKVWKYVEFVHGHGGYAANLLHNQELLSTVGLPVRLLSFVCTCAFFILLLIEDRTSVLRYAYICFIAVLLLTLGIGARGGVMSILAMIWYVHKLKRGTAFKLLPLLLIAASGGLLAALIGYTRSNVAVGSLDLLSFLTRQGISMQVTEIAIAKRHLFEQHAWSYLIYGSHLLPGTANPGHLFSNDVSSYLSNYRVAEGLGAGSSYIGEAFLLGGIVGVAIVSFCVGLILRLLYSLGDRKYGLALTIVLFSRLIFLPRAPILSPLFRGMQYAAGMIFVGIASVLMARAAGLIAKHPPVQLLGEEGSSSPENTAHAPGQ